MRGRFVLGFDDSAISGVCRHDTNREESVATLAAQPPPMECEGRQGHNDLKGNP
jgi:hypothetical protein